MAAPACSSTMAISSPASATRCRPCASIATKMCSTIPARPTSPRMSISRRLPRPRARRASMPISMTQGEFLLGMGLLERAGRLGANADEAAREKICRRGRAPRRPGPDGQAVQGAGDPAAGHRRSALRTVELTCRIACPTLLPHRPRTGPINDFALTKSSSRDNKAAMLTRPSRTRSGRPCSTRRVAGIRHGYFTRVGGVSAGHLSRPEHRHRLGRRPGAGAREPPPRGRMDGRSRRPSADRLPGPFARRDRGRASPFRASGRRPTPSSPTGRASRSAPRPPIAGRCCSPIREARVVGAAHAGWKGAFTGVLENTIAAMETPRRPARTTSSPCSARRSARETTRSARNSSTASSPPTPATTAISRPRAKPGHAMFDLNRYTVDRLTRRRRDRRRARPLHLCRGGPVLSPTAAPRTAPRRITGGRFRRSFWRTFDGAAF